jgi:hypothetical protein
MLNIVLCINILFGGPLIHCLERARGTRNVDKIVDAQMACFGVELCWFITTCMLSAVVYSLLIDELTWARTAQVAIGRKLICCGALVLVSIVLETTVD